MNNKKYTTKDLIELLKEFTTETSIRYYITIAMWGRNQEQIKKNKFGKVIGRYVYKKKPTLIQDVDFYNYSRPIFTESGKNKILDYFHNKFKRRNTPN